MTKREEELERTQHKTILSSPSLLKISLLNQTYLTFAQHQGIIPKDFIFAFQK